MSWRLARIMRMHPAEIFPRFGHALARAAGGPPRGGDACVGIVAHAEFADAAAVARWARRQRAAAALAPKDRRWDRPSWTLDVLRLGLDPKTVWAHGRLQHTALLAHADPAAPEPVADAVAWLDANPQGRGLHWASTLEVAIRLVSLALLAQVRPCGPLRDAIASHAWWLAHTPSVGSSARNHRVAELCALAVAARAIPDSPGAPRWRATAEQLPSVLARQVHPDGVGVEQSTHYLAFVVEWALLASAVGVAHVLEPLAPAVHFLRSVIDGSGAAVTLGDDDGGRVLAIGPGPEPRYVTSVTGAAAAHLGQPAPLGWVPDTRSAWLATPAPLPPQEPSGRRFEHGGLTVLRDKGRLVVFDHGPVGEPDLAAHGHADALALWLHLPTGPVIVGRGTGRYTAAAAHRAFHRSADAHATLTLDGVQPSEPHDHPFLWRSRVAGAAVGPFVERGPVEGSIRWDRAGTMHHRRLWLEPDRLVWTDEVQGTGVRTITVRLPFAPDLELRRRGPEFEVRRRDDVVITVHPDPRCAARIVTGGSLPGIGWHSPSYGRWIEASTLVLTLRSEVPVVLRTSVRFR